MKIEIGRIDESVSGKIHVYQLEMISHATHLFPLRYYACSLYGEPGHYIDFCMDCKEISRC